MYKLITLTIIMLFFIPTLSSCTNKEERCDQVALALMKHGGITQRVYRQGVVQKMCIQEWDTKCIPSSNGGYCRFEDNDGWRECILDANSREDLQKNNCKKMPYQKGAKFQ